MSRQKQKQSILVQTVWPRKPSTVLVHMSLGTLQLPLLGVTPQLYESCLSLSQKGTAKHVCLDGCALQLLLVYPYIGLEFGFSFTKIAVA